MKKLWKLVPKETWSIQWLGTRPLMAEDMINWKLVLTQTTP